MATAAVIAATTMVTALMSGAVFATGSMACVARVALPITRLIRVEVIERLLPTARHWPGVSMARIVAVVDMSIKSAIAVEPRSSSYERSSSEPIRPIVAIGRTAIGSIVVVSIWAYRWRSDLDGNLGL
jgi:hypothetical protein